MYNYHELAQTTCQESKLPKLRKEIKRTGLGLTLLIMLSLTLAACGDNNNGQLVAEVAPRINYLAPDFSLKDYKGDTIKLSDFKGKPVLINFWATWCPPCRAEMPEIEAAYRKYKEKSGLIVLGVDAREEAAAVKKYVADGSYSWYMPMDYAGEVITAYGVVAFPTSFFIDRQGYIRSSQTGGMDKKGLEERLSKIL